MKAFISFTILLCFYCGLSEEWSYDDQDYWPTACKGIQQSPISLPILAVNYIHYEPFIFDEHSTDPKRAYLKNDGHTIEIGILNKDEAPTISGEGLDGTYIFSSMHFHWPSEHTVQGYQYPLEAHFVYYSEKYASVQDALPFKNGIAVLGVLYQVSDKDNPIFSFTSEVPLVKDKINSPIELSYPFVQKEFFPITTYKYFRYNGSLTTPNCDESVIWTVFALPSYISKQQLSLLSTVYDSEGKLMVKNNRNIQNRNIRPIYLVV